MSDQDVFDLPQMTTKNIDPIYPLAAFRLPSKT